MLHAGATQLYDHIFTQWCDNITVEESKTRKVQHDRHNKVSNIPIAASTPLAYGDAVDMRTHITAQDTSLHPTFRPHK